MRYVTYNRYAYDAVWAMAKALNQSLNPLQERKLKLEDFDYFEQGSIILTILKEQLQQINFTGISVGIQMSVCINEYSCLTYIQAIYF